MNTETYTNTKYIHDYRINPKSRKIDYAQNQEVYVYVDFLLKTKAILTIFRTNLFVHAPSKCIDFFVLSIVALLMFGLEP